MSIQLNDAQARAAEQLEGRVLVTAGAGSGKTRMLTERFANAVVPGRLLGWQAVALDSVVAITYTNKAAGEIAERVRAEIGKRPNGTANSRDDLWISTIHGFCTRILRQRPFEAGIDPLFSVASALDTGRLREAAFAAALMRLETVDDNVRRLLDAYSTGAIFQATVDIARQLSVLGLTPIDIAIGRPPSPRSLLNEAEHLFREGTTVCDIDYDGPSNTHLEHADTCRGLLDECSEIDLLGHSDQDVLARIMEVAKRYEPMRPLGAFKDLREQMISGRDRLLGGIGTARVAPYEATLLEIVRLYVSIFAQMKAESGVLDFEDLQTKAVKLLCERPDVAEEYRNRFKVVMIDEFQDTDALQLRLVESVAGANLCTVGDEMQSIYGFRGADVRVYRRHRGEMIEAGALAVELNVNYRAHPQVLGFVNAVFESSQFCRNYALRLEPDANRPTTHPIDEILEDTARVEVLLVDTTDANAASARRREASEIAERLGALVETGLDPGSVAVLLRTYTNAHVYADALVQKGVPVVIAGGGRFFDLTEVEVMRALTKVIASVDDEEALGLLLVSDFIPVADNALFRIRIDPKSHRAPLWEVVCSDGVSLPESDAQALDRLREVIEGARARIGREPLEDVLMRAVEDAGYDLRLLGQGAAGRDCFANVLKFIRRAGEFERELGFGPVGFSAYLDDRERFRDLEAPDTAGVEGGGAVRIMSIHASKGLEFEVVAVPDIGAGTRGDSSIARSEGQDGELRIALALPKSDDDSKAPPRSTWLQSFIEAEDEASAQESERLLYVALTRARDLLLVSGSGRLNPKSRSKAPSDVIRLARVLGLDTPIGGTRDELLEVPGAGVCRFRVVVPQAATEVVATSEPEQSEALPPHLGEPLARPDTRDWLPQTVSYTQLSEFERCPRQFRIRRVLGIAPPTPVSSDEPQPMQLGNALHAALRLVSADGTPPTSARVEALARYFELSVADAGRFADALATYCDSDVAARVCAFDSVLREAPLSISVDGGRFVIAGSIDLYARRGADALIVDYKSGASGTTEELQERYRLQAACYAFAAFRDGCDHVEVVFVRPEVVRSGQMERVSYDFAAEAASDIERELTDRYRQIERSGFEPQPGSSCNNCDVPIQLCEHRPDRFAGRRRS